MAVDAIRRPYRRKAIFYLGQTVETDIVWQFVPPGTPVFPLATRFTPLAAYQQWQNVGGVGEQTDSRADFKDNTPLSPWADGSHYEGTEADHLGLSHVPPEVEAGTIPDVEGCYYRPTVGVGFEDMLVSLSSSQGGGNLEGELTIGPLDLIADLESEDGGGQFEESDITDLEYRSSEDGGGMIDGPDGITFDDRTAEDGGGMIDGPDAMTFDDRTAEDGGGMIDGPDAMTFADRTAEDGGGMVEGEDHFDISEKSSADGGGEFDGRDALEEAGGMSEPSCEDGGGFLDEP